MSGHTEGPWKVGGVDNNIWIERPNPNDACICDIVPSVTDGVDASYSAEDEANARLIAAAPDLLAALHLAAEALDAYSDVNDGPDGPTPNRAMSALQEIGIVLAKAEGR